MGQQQHPACRIAARPALQMQMRQAVKQRSGIGAEPMPGEAADAGRNRQGIGIAAGLSRLYINQSAHDGSIA
ncbi:hypothetical protein GCM10011505_23950 [Tistrella bauzanensis]|uniref:Uncharacterized protein n=1 Tax=Tistrella bauzanensis TaxID=657419 RepID=A0ABQ1IJ11_9PROT|nr:hypothetical protein GCM10011505_23950 [Tistrella bauzanensis]